MKKLFKLISVSLISMCLASCSSPSENSSSQTSQYDSGISSIEIYRLESYGMLDFEWVFTNGGISEYAVRGVNKDGTTFDNVQGNANWRVEDSSIAGVDSSGHVTGKKDGVTNLVARYGGLQADFQLKVRTIAKTFELKEQENEYRTGVLHTMPLNLSPANATIDYTLSRDDIISLSANYPNRFTVKEVGTVHVTAHAYTTWRGEQGTLEFDITTKNKDAPVFYYKGNASTSSIFTCAKNKYSSLPINQLNLIAKDKDDNELTIHIKEDSTYSLTTVGTYDVVLYATDTTRNLTSFYYLTLEVEEYEERSELSPIDAVGYSNYSMTTESDTPYSLSINSITFSARVYLNSKYACSDGVLHFWFHIRVKVWSQSRYIDEEFKTDIQMSKDGPTSFNLSKTWHKASDLDPNTLVVTPNIFLSGNVYTHIYY